MAAAPDPTPWALRAEPLEPDPVVDYYRQFLDLSLLRESLKLTVEERMANLVELQRLAEEARRAGAVAGLGRAR